MEKHDFKFWIGNENDKTGNSFTSKSFAADGENVEDCFNKSHALTEDYAKRPSERYFQFVNRHSDAKKC